MKHVLSVFVENQTGVLVRVVSMFSRREFKEHFIRKREHKAPRSPGNAPDRHLCVSEWCTLVLSFSHGQWYNAPKEKPCA